jgi:hypothetical protein
MVVLDLHFLCGLVYQVFARCLGCNIDHLAWLPLIVFCCNAGSIVWCCYALILGVVWLVARIPILTKLLVHLIQCCSAFFGSWRVSRIGVSNTRRSIVSSLVFISCNAKTCGCRLLCVRPPLTYSFPGKGCRRGKYFSDLISNRYCSLLILSAENTFFPTRKTIG